VTVRRKAKGRFAGIPFAVIRTKQYAALSGSEVKLLIDLLEQYNGSNNGKLSPTISLMEKRGWAKATLWRAKTGLIKKGFLVVTRQGWKRRGKPTLVAITWNAIDETDIVYDEGVGPCARPLNYWCKAKSEAITAPMNRKVKKAA